MRAADTNLNVALGRWTRALVINGLGLYVMLMYGITYYAVTTAALRMSADLGVPASTVFGVMTVGLLISAAFAPTIGRWTDRVGAAIVLLIGALARALMLVAMALAPEATTCMLALLVVQVLGLLTEYDATFAAAVDMPGDRARTGMSQITLWGGIASTVFWPATAFLLEKVDWRHMFLLYAAILLVVCVPVAALLRQVPRVAALDRGPALKPAADSPPLTAPSRMTFALVAAAFAFGGIVYNLPSLMLPVLEGLGLGASAILIGMIFGPSQTAGRFFDMVFGGRVSAIAAAVLAAAMVVVALAVLLVGWASAGIVFAVLFGAGAGVSSIVRGSVVLAIYGRMDYATWLGRVGRIRLIVTAMSPFGLALILESFGARAVVYTCGVAAVLSFACFVVLAIQSPTPANPEHQA
jgi:Major Facilitator Superfamily